VAGSLENADGDELDDSTVLVDQARLEYQLHR